MIIDHGVDSFKGAGSTQHRQKPARGEGVRVGPWPNSDSFPLQLAILPWYSDGLVLKSKFLSVYEARSNTFFGPCGPKLFVRRTGILEAHELFVPPVTGTSAFAY